MRLARARLLPLQADGGHETANFIGSQYSEFLPAALRRGFSWEQLRLFENNARRVFERCSVLKWRLRFTSPHQEENDYQSRNSDRAHAEFSNGTLAHL